MGQFAYHILGDIPEDLRRHFDGPVIDFVVGRVSMVEGDTFKVIVRHVAGSPTYTFQVPSGNMPRAKGMIFLVGKPEETSIGAYLKSSEDTPELEQPQEEES